MDGVEEFYFAARRESPTVAIEALAALSAIATAAARSRHEMPRESSRAAKSRGSPSPHAAVHAPPSPKPREGRRPPTSPPRAASVPAASTRPPETAMARGTPDDPADRARGRPDRRRLEGAHRARPRAPDSHKGRTDARAPGGRATRHAAARWAGATDPPRGRPRARRSGAVPRPTRRRLRRRRLGRVGKKL